MRTKVVFGLLVVVFIAFGVMLSVRPRTAHNAPPVAKPDPATSSSVASPASASASAPGSVASAAASSPIGKKLLSRSLRVVAVSWDLLAPGLLINRGLKPTKDSAFTTAGLDTAFASVKTMQDLEGALARGGEDPNGADIAILPLPEFVAGYERLRALNPKIFFVLGHSRGRELLYSREHTLEKFPRKKELQVGGEGGTSEAFLGLFLLDLAGAEKLTLSNSKDAAFDVVARSPGGPLPEPPKGKLLMTSADAPGLVPLVAIAQTSFIEKEGLVLSTFVKLWLEGENQVQTDAAGAARKIAAFEGTPDAPALIHRLGPIAWASILDNARLAGLSGRGAVTLDALFQRTWSTWRDANVLSTPAPEIVTVAPDVIAGLVRSIPNLAKPPEPERNDDSRKKSTKDEKVLLVARLSEKLDEPTVVSEIGFIAGLFERSKLRVTVRTTRGYDPRRTKSVVNAVRGRFDLTSKRVVARIPKLKERPTVIQILAVQ